MKFLLCVIFFCSAFQLNAQNPTWLTVLSKDAAIPNEISQQGIEYDHFLWIEKGKFGQQLLSQSEWNVVESHQPFHFRVDDQMIDMKSGSLPDNEWFINSSSTAANLYLVQFNGPIKKAWLQQLKAKQIELIKPLAPFSWIVWAKPEQLAAIPREAHVRLTSYFYPAFKVQVENRGLGAASIPSMALVLNQTAPDALFQLEVIGATIHSTQAITKDLLVVNLTLRGDAYLPAASIPGLITLQQVHLDGGPRGEMSQQSIVGNYDNSNQVQTGYASWLSDTGLDGTGVTVAVVDGGIYQNHPDLSNVVACTGDGASCVDGNDSHGTHVAGAIGGTGQANSLNAAGFNRGLGVAPGVEIVEQRYGPLLGAGPGGMVAGGMLSIYKDSATSGALLSNNSWGPTGTPQGYDIPTMEIDMISRDANPDVAGDQPVLAVWSIMNGNGDRNSGSCAPSSLGSPDEAKNLFAVGSTKLQNFDASQIAEIFDISSNSAHGPACDGRLVPHIVAPGCRTEAPDSSTGYGMKCGTSMASPVMSGSISLFWEQYRNSFATDPSPALVKATFTAVADNLEGEADADGNSMAHAPNRQQGWGRVNLDRVVNPAEAVWYYDQQTVFTDSGQMWSIQLTPVDDNQAMRLMLVWTDAPGAGLGGTNPAWVNNLDLQVTADATFYLGNQFGPDAYSTSGGSADGINNMEAVFLRPDQHNGSAITIVVQASNLSADALNPYNPGSPQQDFALVCYNCQTVNVGNDVIYTDSFDVFVDLIFADNFE